MALVKGNQSFDIDAGTTGGAPYTATLANHNQNTGSGGLLIVLIASSTSYSISGNVQYGGQDMTLLGGPYDAATSNIRLSVWYLTSPPTGLNDVTLNMSNVTNVSICAWSLTGASVPSIAHTGLQNTPHTQSVTIADQSMVLGIGASAFAFDSAAAITIDGTSFGYASCEVNGNISSGTICAQLRDANLSAGSKDVTIDTIADSFQATNTIVYIGEAAGGSGSAEGNWWLLLR